MKKKGPQKIGLVLSGGGGKGAYEIGVLQALQESGLNFSCVAGTSIGAFNAILASSGNLEDAKHIWLKLNTWNIIKLSKTILLLPISCLSIFGDPTYRYQDDISRKRFILFRIGNLIFMLLGLFLSFLILGTSPHLTKLDYLLIACFMVLWGLIGPLKDRLNAAIAKPTGLKKIIETYVNWDEIRSGNVPIFVTVAKKLANYASEQLWIPVYIRLDKLEVEEALNFVLGSMAIPFGFKFSRCPI